MNATFFLPKVHRFIHSFIFENVQSSMYITLENQRSWVVRHYYGFGLLTRISAILDTVFLFRSHVCLQHENFSAPSVMLIVVANLQWHSTRNKSEGRTRKDSRTWKFVSQDAPIKRNKKRQVQNSFFLIWRVSLIRSAGSHSEKLNLYCGFVSDKQSLEVQSRSLHLQTGSIAHLRGTFCSILLFICMVTH